MSAVSLIPMFGDYFGKGRKGTKYLLKVADLTKLERNKKVLKMLDSLDIFVKARKADMGELQKWIRKNLDNLARGGDEVVELVTPDGLRIRISGDFRANINLIDETGEMVREAVRLGDKVGDSGKALKEGNEIGIFKGVDNTTLKDTVKSHVFSQKHLKTGIMDLGSSQDEILDKGINIIKEA